MKKILILIIIKFNFTILISLEQTCLLQSTVNRAAETLGGGLTKL